MFNFKDPKTTQTSLNLKASKLAGGGEDIYLECPRVILQGGGGGGARLQQHHSRKPGVQPTLQSSLSHLPRPSLSKLAFSLSHARADPVLVSHEVQFSRDTDQPLWIPFLNACGVDLAHLRPAVLPFLN